MNCGALQHQAAMNSHALGVFALMITLRIDKTQGLHAEVGAEPGHTPNVELPCWLHQNDHPWGMG